MKELALSAGDFARLVDASQTDLAAWRAACEPSVSWPENLDSHFDGQFRYSDALAVFIARQLSANDSICSGPSMAEALRFVGYAGAVAFYFESSPSAAAADFWAGVASTRNESKNGRPAEYWSSMRFAGLFDQVMREMHDSLGRQKLDYPEAEPARVFIANVSAADRQLRKRAASLGINLGIE